MGFEQPLSGEIFTGISQDSIDAIQDYFAEIFKREPDSENDAIIQGNDTIFPLTDIPPEQFDEVQTRVAEILTNTEGADKFTIAVGMSDTDDDVLIISIR